MMTEKVVMVVAIGDATMADPDNHAWWWAVAARRVEGPRTQRVNEVCAAGGVDGDGGRCNRNRRVECAGGFCSSSNPFHNNTTRLCRLPRLRASEARR